jgi:hypothetical protein
MNHTLALFVLTSTTFAQHISIGIKGCVPFTGAFSNFTSVDAVTHTFSDSKEYVIGPMLEVHLPLGLSIEADGLYRPLNLAVENRTASSVFRSVTNITSWEFPIVGKYHLSLPLVKPYVEAGPSFRWTGSNTGYLSGKGFVIGGGVDVKLGRLRVGPEIRYTRWGSDAAPPPGVPFFPPSQANQAEFLVGLSF